MIKRTLAAAAALLLLLAGCVGHETSPAIDPAKYQEEFQTNWQYRYLSDDEKVCYGTLYTALTDTVAQDDTVTITHGDDTTQEYPGIRIKLPHPMESREAITRLYDAFFRDNPQFFYVGGSYGVEGYRRNGQAYYDTLVLAYTMPAGERAQAIRHLETAVETLAADCPVGADDYTTELYLHDRLAAGCTYDDRTAEDGYTANPNAFTAYGALVEGRAVCEGYSRAMQLLLRQYGIPATLVLGEAKADGEDHMWNLVTIGGRNYHLDVTWNDSDDSLRHTYFNLSTALLEQSHVLTQGQSGIDTCTATEDNFFRRNGTYIDTYERQTIAEAIARRIQAGDSPIELRFAPDKFDNGVLFLKSEKLAKKMVDACLAAEGKTLWDYELAGEPTQHVLTLTKKG